MIKSATLNSPLNSGAKQCQWPELGQHRITTHFVITWFNFYILKSHETSPNLLPGNF
jgi:hypothetical protein